MSEARLPEDPGVPNGVVAGALAGFFALVLVAAAAVWVLYPSARHDAAVEVAAFPAPGLEIEPVAEYVRYAAEEQARLAGSGDRMPIGEAMDRIAARGVGAFDPLPAPAEVAP